jgi:hypothetical protein
MALYQNKRLLHREENGMIPNEGFCIVKETIIRMKTATHASDRGLKSTVQKELKS